MEAVTVTGPAKNLLAFASRDRVRMHVATYQRQGTSTETPFLHAARNQGTPCFLIPEQGRFDHGVIGRLDALVEQVQPDVVQTHSYKSHLVARLAGIWRNRPWIAFHHGYTATDRKDELLSHGDRFSLQRADHVVTVCQPFADELTSRGVPPDRITILHNTVPAFARPSEEERRRARAGVGVTDDTPVVLSVGRLSKEKAHMDLLRAFSMLLADGVPARLLIVGEGPERSALEGEAAALQLGDSVKLMGQQNQMRPFYVAADAFVLPSHSEGSPNVLLEAFAAGLPTVATRVGGVPELAEDGVNAMLVPARTPAALASALKHLLQNPAVAQTIASEATQYVLRNHAFEAYDQKLLGIYQAVMVKREGSRSNSR
jgi:glycosyltransferase involved in cell wall biosynthesis